MFSLAPLLVSVIAAAGARVVLIAWVYYAAQIFLLGAEFTRAYAGEYRRPRDTARAA